jgi:hypothetical protein
LYYDTHPRGATTTQTDGSDDGRRTTDDGRRTTDDGEVEERKGRVPRVKGRVPRLKGRDETEAGLEIWKLTQFATPTTASKETRERTTEATKTTRRDAVKV